jgi:SAM-dependent methyltransferase
VETYTYGHGGTVTRVHAERTAEREAAFFLPHLRPGMRLLDAGCGPGSITIGLAAAVTPGETIGVDAAEAVLDQARSLACEQGVSSLRFQQGDAYALPFPDASFDAVFAHTLLEHLREPARALAELRRVLRPGGVIGLRDCDWASGVWWPEDPALTLAADLYARLWRHNGGDPHCGRRLRAHLIDTGFAQVQTSASFRWDGTHGSSRSFATLLAERLPVPPMADAITRLGWATQADLDALARACLAWSERPDAYAAMIMAEAVAWNP